MIKTFFRKISDKGITGIALSLKMRFIYTFITPWYSLNSPFARAIWKLFHLLPVNRKLIIFESEPDFCDNSWSLYQYIKANRPQYHFVWIVKNIDEFKKKADSRTSFATRYGKGLHIKIIYYFATAGWFFYTHGTFQPYKPRTGQTVVNLWHGGYPLKATKVKNRDYFDWLISLGEKGKEELSKYLSCPIEKVLPLGYPRIDLLCKNISSGVDNPFCRNKEAKKVILWMTTFRTSINPSLSEELCDSDTGLPLLNNLDDLLLFDKHLHDFKVFVIVKIHHLQAQKDVFKTKFNNILFLTDDVLASKDMQLYEILGKSDALVTDFSSVTWDYLSVDKPMAFILTDKEVYEKSCGFNVDNIEDLLKGEHINTIEQLMQFIQHVIEGRDDFRTERQKQLESGIQKYPHGGNSKAIVEYLGL